MRALRHWGVLVLATVGASCAKPAPPPPRLERLLPSLGPATFVRLDDETRPAALLQPGQTRVYRTEIEPGTRLVFAVGLKDSPARGFLRFTIRADDRIVFDDRLAVARRDHWWHRTVAFEHRGPLTLTFRGEYQKGNTRVADPAENQPWIVVGAPRLYRPATAKGRRVLLWISQDTLRADHLGTYGYTLATSPGFDRMAKDWVVFDTAAATCSWTLPSLASQLTSRHPTYHGAVLHNLPINDASPALFEALARSGFTVLGVTANDLLSPAHGLARGFDVLRFRDGRAADLSRLLQSSLDEWGGGDLALFVHFMDPHAPYTPPLGFARLFDTGHEGAPAPHTDFEALSRIEDPSEVARVQALYDAEIAYADEEIAALVEALGTRDLLGGAVLAYTADHGEELRDHGSWHHGGTLYEEVIHVPFALRAPGLPGRRVRQTVSLLDLAPTLLALLGVDAPPGFQGRSLVPLMRGGTLPEAPVYAETALTKQRHHLVSVREGRFKYMLEVPPGRETAPQILGEFLYDLDADPGERTSRLDTPEAERLRRYALAYLARARSEAKETKPVDLDPATLERLKALGYVQ